MAALAIAFVAAAVWVLDALFSGDPILPGLLLPHSVALLIRRMALVAPALAAFIVLALRKRATLAAPPITDVIEQSNVSVMITDLRGRIEYVNPFFERSTGYASAEVLGRNPRLLRSGRHEAGLYKELWSTIAEGRVWRGVLCNRHKDGSLFYEDATIVPLRGADGRINRYAAVKLNITAQMARERELRLTQQFLEGYRKAVDESALVSLADPEGTVLYVNQKFCDTTGYDREELTGRHQDDLFGVAIPTRPGPSGFFDGKAAWHGVVECRSRTPGRVFVDLTVIPILDADAGLLQFIAVGHDVSELKAAMEKAQVAERAKTEFLAQMSHEIRTPLNGLVGFLELLDRTSLDAVQSEYLRNSSLSAKVLMGIITDILDLSRIERGKLELEEIPFGLREEMETTVDVFLVNAEQKGIELAAFIDPGLPRRIEGDPLRLREVLTNLLSNSLKFTPRGGSVLLEARVMQEDPCRVLFAVTDTGIGIPQDKQSLIFEAFSQADISIARDFGGTGLGLTIASRLVRLMGGELHLESREGRGSRFHFEIALKALEPPEQRLSLAGLVEEAWIVNRGGGTLTARVLRELLEAGGLRVRETASWDDVADPALLLVVCSREPTVEAAEALRRFDGVPLVVLASASTRGGLETALPPRVRVITCPLYESKLRAALEEIFHGAQRLIERLQAREPARPRLSARVLLAEDNQINQKLLGIKLEEFGLSVDIASDGGEAVAMFDGRRYDLVLMDVSMPVVDGVEATQRMLEIESRRHRPHTPIVALTAHALKGDREKLLQAGMDDYLPKPVDFNNLYDLLRRYVPVAEGQPGLAPARAAPESAGGPSWPHILAGTGLERADAERLVARFFETAGESLQRLDRAARAGDVDALFRGAHRLKGTAGNLRLGAVSEAARKIEQAARSGEIAAAAAQLEALRQEVLSSRAALFGDAAVSV